MKTLPLALLAAAGCLALVANTTAAPAQTAPEPDPDTIILSDSLHYDDISKTSTFTGNVVLTRGPMTLRAAKLTTHEDAQGNQFGSATAGQGEHVTIRQENPEKFETLIATGLQADYVGQSGDITLTGQATVTRQICGQAVDNVRGARIIYHQKSGTYEAFGGKNSAASGGRVRSLAQSQSRVDQAIAKCKAGQS
ncbi:lipopolysaccharide transport periplasmic protein LptA [Castellaniella sp.]|uniref:lipopolysaccharide transport periplasmic protein LptA n=1 Tax=Castellaniella sp. TaxID=1955812 RepID=UPI002AFF88BB|nr:lipopolysaccharide transport periplasmic protein LptA [Castellaniella sp.]